MAFIVKIPKRQEIVTTTVNEINLPDGNISFIAYSSVDNDLWGVGRNSFGVVNQSTGIIDIGDFRFVYNNIDVVATVNNDNTADINVSISITATNRSAEDRTLASPTLLVRLTAAASDLRSMSQSFTPADASKQFGIFSDDAIGVTFNDIVVSGNETKQFTANGTVSVNLVYGNTPMLIDQLLTDTTLSDISTQVSRNITSGSLSFNQKYILGGTITPYLVNINDGNSDTTTTYDNVQFTDPNETYFIGSVLEYDDSLVPEYYFRVGNSPSFLSTQITYPSTTATPTTSAPSFPVTITDASIEANTLEFTLNNGIGDYFVEFGNASLTIIGQEPTFDTILATFTYTSNGLKSEPNILLLADLNANYIVRVTDGNGDVDTTSVEVVARTPSLTTSSPSTTSTPSAICPDISTVTISTIFGGSQGTATFISYGMGAFYDSRININDYQVIGSYEASLGGAISLVPADFVTSENRIEFGLPQGNDSVLFTVRFTPRLGAPPECSEFTISRSIDIDENSNTF